MEIVTVLADGVPRVWERGEIGWLVGWLCEGEGMLMLMLMLSMTCLTRWLVRDGCNGLTVAKADWEEHGLNFEDMVDYGFTIQYL